MAFSTQPNFVGILDGTNVNDLNKKIDYSKTHLEERKKLVEKITSETKFYEEYFSNYFKATINAGDQLSTNVNVCKSLERMANYLLNSKEIKQEEDAEKTQYVFHTDERYFQKKVERELSVEQLANTENPDHEDSVIHFLKRDEPNYRKEKVQTIDFDKLKPTNKNSMETIEEVKFYLGEYKKLYDYVTEKLINKDKDTNRYLLTKVKGQVTDDMIYTKDSLLGIFGYDLRNAGKETSQPNMDVFDFTNESHIKGKTIEFVGQDRRGNEVIHRVTVKGLLYFKPELDPTDDFSLVLHDFNETVKKANLTDEEQLILELIRSGMTQEEVAEELNTYHMKISRIIDRITNKIIAVGNKYDLSGVAN